MKRLLLCILVLMMSQVSVMGMSEITNGSFEADGGRVGDLTYPGALIGWDRLNSTTTALDGWVDDDWPTEGDYCLTLTSYFYYDFFEGDYVSLSQQVNLADVNYISFDIRLTTYDDSWNPNLRTAVVMIDDEVVWSSDDKAVDGDVRGEFYGERIDVCNIGNPDGCLYNDFSSHELKVALIVDQDDYFSYESYFVDIDNITFHNHCDGLGFARGDFNRDCVVNIDDLALLCDIWLSQEDGYSIHNVYRSRIDLKDYAIVTDNWDGDPNVFDEITAQKNSWLQEVGPDHEANSYEIENFDRINFYDFAEFENSWIKELSESVE